MSACGPSVVDVITCVVHYTIDPDQIAAFEQFARAWMRHVDEHGGTHHGYYLPAEGVSDRAESLFSFPSLAAYEQYRTLFGTHPDFIAADRIRDESGCVLRYERTFMRPLLPPGTLKGTPAARSAQPTTPQVSAYRWVYPIAKWI